MKNDLRFKSKAITFGVMLVLLFSLPWPAAAKKVMDLDIDFKSPVIAAVNEKGFYLYDQQIMEIYFFSRKTLKSPFKFGRYGEGPSEFLGIHHVTVNPDYIFVSTEGKNAYFTPEGKLIKEIKTEYATIKFMPLGNNFVCQKFVKDALVVKIFDKNLNLKKDNVEIFPLKQPNNILDTNGKRSYWMVKDYFRNRVDENRLYIANSQKGFYIGVYDSEGRKLYEINREYKKMQITARDKEDIMGKLRDDIGKQRYEAGLGKYNILFPDYYPAYSGFFVADGKIYVMIYPVKDNKRELLVLDLDGNLLKIVDIPVIGDFDEQNFIFKGNYYYIYDNELRDKWELHEIKLD